MLKYVRRSIWSQLINYRERIIVHENEKKGSEQVADAVFFHGVKSIVAGNTPECIVTCTNDITNCNDKCTKKKNKQKSCLTHARHYARC